MKTIIKSLFLLYFFPWIMHAQIAMTDSTLTQKPMRFNIKATVLPAALITYGLIGLNNKELIGINTATRTEIKEHIDQKLSIDDLSQYSPALTTYGLNALGITGKHQFKDRTLLLTTAYLLMTSTVTSLKYTTRVERPDGSTLNSFPSGHTATAFLGAEFLYQEYKHKSVWYGISGYAIAATTGYFRMYNNRHWFSDVAAGAGIGILSMKAAYWLYPKISRFLFSKKHTKATSSIIPFLNEKTYGICIHYRF